MKLNLILTKQNKTKQTHTKKKKTHDVNVWDIPNDKNLERVCKLYDYIVGWAFKRVRKAGA